MRDRHAGDKLGVLPDHRRALIRNLTLALIEHESIQTTPRRAKALRWYADHVVELAKRGDLASRRQIIQMLGSTETKVAGQNRVRLAIDKVYADIAPRFTTRKGGYTQLFRLLQRRRGDNAELCILRYIPGEEDKKSDKKPTKVAKEKAPAKKKVAAPAAEDKKVAKAAKVEDKPVDKKAKKKS